MTVHIGKLSGGAGGGGGGFGGRFGDDSGGGGLGVGVAQISKPPEFMDESDVHSITEPLIISTLNGPCAEPWYVRSPIET